VVDANNGRGGIVDARRDGLEGNVYQLTQAKFYVLLNGPLAAQAEQGITWLVRSAGRTRGLPA
jgi:hypothetical protein